MNYEFVQHKHRFAAWCAATASSASPKCRFTVRKAFELLEEIDFARQVQAQSWNDCRSFDEWHGKCCSALIDQANLRGVGGFSYGVAAKMVNCYVKAFYLGDEKVLSVAHPPIDRLLLSGFIKSNVGNRSGIWRKYRDKGWSTFTREEYLELIGQIRSNDDFRLAMWKAERHWRGFRDGNC